MKMISSRNAVRWLTEKARRGGNEAPEIGKGASGVHEDEGHRDPREQDHRGPGKAVRGCH
ncbi:MAG: hypothetical protein MZV70_66145 [Desulfobacterales bacterium]|nr:hypothetical protein [Desulfobacterales bacterium]